MTYTYIVIEGEIHKAEYQLWNRVIQFPPWKGNTKIVAAGGRQKLLGLVTDIQLFATDCREIYVAFDKTPAVWAYALLTKLQNSGVYFTTDFSFEEALLVSEHPKVGNSLVRELFKNCARLNLNPYSQSSLFKELNMPQYKGGWINREKAAFLELNKLTTGKSLVTKKNVGNCWVGWQMADLECIECGAECRETPINELAKFISETPKEQEYHSVVLLTPEICGGETTFEFELRGRVTLVCDKSGSAKTLFCDRLLVAKSDGFFENVRIFNKGGLSEGNTLLPIDATGVLHQLKHLSNCLIVIDEADEILTTDSIRHFIERDLDNDYLLMARTVLHNSVGCTVAGIAHMAGSVAQKHLEYSFNIGGW